MNFFLPSRQYILKVTPHSLRLEMKGEHAPSRPLVLLDSDPQWESALQAVHLIRNAKHHLSPETLNYNLGQLYTQLERTVPLLFTVSELTWEGEPHDTAHLPHSAQIFAEREEDLAGVLERLYSWPLIGIGNIQR